MRALVRITSLTALTCSFGLLAQSPPRYRALPIPVPSGWQAGNGLDSGIVLGDFDGDGFADLLGRGAQLARGDGNGSFAAPVPFGTLPAAAAANGLRQMAVADFDQDGRDDVAAVVGMNVALHLSRPQGLLAVPLPIPSLGLCPGARILPVAGDVDGDGRPDLLVARQVCGGSVFSPGRPGSPVLLRNLGGGNFAPVTLPNVALDATWAWIVDADGDADQDLLFLQTTADPLLQPNGRLVWLRQGPGLVFAPAVALAQGVLAPSVLESADLGDVDGDGDQDVVIASPGTSGEVLRNVGGAFVPSGSGPQSIGAAAHVRLHDLDGDGAAEAVLPQHDYRLEIWELTGSGSMQRRAALGIGMPREAAVATIPVFGDLDGDQDLDVVLPHAVRPLVWFGDAAGGFTAATTGPSGAMPTGTFADFDGDGWIDQIGFDVGELAIGLNDGSGRMVPQDWSFPVLHLSPTLTYVQPFDWEGDGDPDLLVFDGRAASDTRIVVRNDGGGTFSIAQRSVGDGDVVRTRLVDVDGDADLDMLVVRRGTHHPPLELLRNFGAGTWQRQVIAQIPELFDAQPCNADGDGAVDLLIVGLFDGVAGIGRSKLLHNDGTGTFTAVPGFPTLAAWTGAVGDLDADGDDDFVLDGTVVRNLGAAGFATTPLLSTGRVWGITDVDRDGRRDIVFSASTVLVVFGQQPGGTFQQVEQQVLPTNQWPQFPGRQRLADFDRDGDLDLVVWDGLFADTGHQLTRRLLPRLGRPSTKVVMAPVGTAVAVLAGFGRVALPIPPYGTLFVDPASLIVLGIATVPAGGEFEVTNVVPNVATLLGIEITWQTVMFDGPTLSGLEAGRIAPR